MTTQIDWQPIDGAPQDGTEFLALSAKGRVTIARYEADRYARTPRPYFALAGFGVPRILEDRANQPVRWAPLATRLEQVG